MKRHKTFAPGNLPGARLFFPFSPYAVIGGLTMTQAATRCGGIETAGLIAGKIYHIIFVNNRQPRIAQGGYLHAAETRSLVKSS